MSANVTTPTCPVYGVKSSTASRGQRRCKCDVCRRWWADYTRAKRSPGTPRRTLGPNHRRHAELAKQFDHAIREDFGLLLAIARDAALFAEATERAPGTDK